MRVRPCPEDAIVEHRAALTNSLGGQPLWAGYGEGATAVRTPEVVRTDAPMGRVYRALVEWRTPTTVVEIGTAFGVSGMYWLAGLERAGSGRLVTFDPNPTWAEIARDNLAAVGGRFTSVVGTFEAEAGRELGAGRSIDLAFIDAIHTSDVVQRQFEDVARRAKPGAVIVFDDINFSADMRFAWTRLAEDPRVAAAVTFGTRVGMLELA